MWVEVLLKKSFPYNQHTPDFLANKKRGPPRARTASVGTSTVSLSKGFDIVAFRLSASSTDRHIVASAVPSTPV